MQTFLYTLLYAVRILTENIDTKNRTFLFYFLLEGKLKFEYLYIELTIYYYGTNQRFKKIYCDHYT
jgi:hypothetical protein